jgi:hypothetical protein
LSIILTISLRFLPGIIILKSLVDIKSFLLEILNLQPSTATALMFVPSVSIKMPFNIGRLSS